MATLKEGHIDKTVTAAEMRGLVDDEKISIIILSINNPGKSSESQKIHQKS